MIRLNVCWRPSAGIFWCGEFSEWPQSAMGFGCLSDDALGTTEAGVQLSTLRPTQTDRAVRHRPST